MPRNQEKEYDCLDEVVYTKGLTQEQLCDVFTQIYVEHYSKTSISHMVEKVRSQVGKWLGQGLEEYAPVIFMDYVHIKIHRKLSVASEEFHLVLTKTKKNTHDVLGIYDMFKGRGLQRIGLMVADGLNRLDTRYQREISRVTHNRWPLCEEMIAAIRMKELLPKQELLNQNL
jgi:transposase-like protein